MPQWIVDFSRVDSFDSLMAWFMDLSTLTQVILGAGVIGLLVFAFAALLGTFK